MDNQQQDTPRIEYKFTIVNKTVIVNGKAMILPVKVYENGEYIPGPNPVGCKSLSRWQDWYSSAASHK